MAALLIVAAALFICIPGPAIAAPALFVVQGPAGKVYLFGTVHVLREGTQWRSPELEAAIGSSQDLYLEIADAGDVVAAMKSVAAIGFDRDHPLSTKISKADVAMLDAAAKQYGLAGEAAFEPMRPWLAFMMLSALPSTHAGYTPGNGVDLQIRKEFADAGKPIHGFETFDMQAHIFADMPEATQIALLEGELKNIGKQNSATQMESLVDVWLSGDEDAMAAKLQLDKFATTPIYTQMLTNRNKAWAAALAELLKQPGTSFVSVGAAHLAGEYGVPALLQKMGFTVTRVAIADVPASPVASISPSPSPSATTSPAPTPAPKPATLNPPNGWKPRTVTLGMGPMKVDRVWVGPEGRGVIITAHLDLEGLGSMDLDTFGTFLQQGMAGAAGNTVEPPKRAKICGGKQDALIMKVTAPTTTQDIVLTIAGRGYLAQYVRNKDVPADPAAVNALFSLCAPQ